MKLINFQVDGDGISLNWQGHNLDLHNSFDFESLYYNPMLKQLKLLWLRSPEKWARNAALPSLKLTFNNVSFFRLKERDADYPISEDKCLAGLSFHSTELRDEFNSISLESSPDDDLTFFFQSEWGFKVNADSAELSSYPPPER